MQLRQDPPLHLTYCLNIHPGETWADNLQAIKDFSLKIKDRVAPNRSFGLGLRLSHQAAVALGDLGELARFKTFLAAHDLYVFTINGFPYGTFHGDHVKEQVYRPDWRTQERKDYTMRLGRILAELLPEGVPGSISTVPGTYKPWMRGAEDLRRIVDNLIDCVDDLVSIRSQTGRDISVGLEPEPDCLLETTDETTEFFNRHLLRRGTTRLASRRGCSRTQAEKDIRRHLGVCLDACHLSLQFEDMSRSLRDYEESDIRISKIQLSAALKSAITDEAVRQLEGFCDDVYLHQVRVRDSYANTESYPDLSHELLADIRKGETRELRTHFHVPLYFAGHGAVQSTVSDLTPVFFRDLLQLSVSALEIETYTFGVLPEHTRSPDVIDSVAEEYAWAIRKIGLGKGRPVPLS